MQSATKRAPQRQPRSDATRKKILDAAVELIGEVGSHGLTLALAAERAGVSRALPTYQFNTRHALLEAAAAAVLQQEPTGPELGFEPLLAWMHDQLDGSRPNHAPMRARLALVVGPPDPSTSTMVAAYWSARLDLALGHLERARVLEQIADGLDLRAVAAALMGQLHGEMARLAWDHGEASSEAFLTLVRNSLAPTTPQKPQPQRRPRAPDKSQGLLL